MLETQPSITDDTFFQVSIPLFVVGFLSAIMLCSIPYLHPNALQITVFYTLLVMAILIAALYIIQRRLYTLCTNHTPDNLEPQYRVFQLYSVWNTIYLNAVSTVYGMALFALILWAGSTFFTAPIDMGGLMITPLVSPVLLISSIALYAAIMYLLHRFTKITRENNSDTEYFLRVEFDRTA